MRVSLPFRSFLSRWPVLGKHEGYSRSLTAVPILQQCDAAAVDWDDRIGLQSRFTNEEKGWRSKVEWKPSTFGTGVFACEDIPKNTTIRLGQIGQNLLGFRNPDELISFAGDNPAKWRYLQDYLWGLYLDTDTRGYRTEESNRMWVGMWIPGNGLNHNPSPNTAYRDFGNGQLKLVTLTDVTAGDELWDDYRRYADLL